FPQKSLSICNPTGYAFHLVVVPPTGQPLPAGRRPIVARHLLVGATAACRQRARKMTATGGPVTLPQTAARVPLTSQFGGPSLSCGVQQEMRRAAAQPWRI